jgi:tRNA (cmo5U34)-methyltransferase
VTSSLVLSVLTLQFTPIEYRQQIVRRVFESLAPGGAFILVEKVLGATAKLDEAFVNLFLNIKRENGYSDEQIDRKRMSLEGVLVPVTARWNEELLHQEGFTSVDCFWRHLNFAGWVAVKP